MRNVARGLPRSDERILLKTTTFRQDVEEAMKLLGEKGWLFEECTVMDAKGIPRWGLCFAHPTRIQVLKNRGYFTQFDSTHKTNAWGHNMFSFLVRNEQGIWIPGAHCVVERENSEILAHTMKAFKRWCGWKPRYVLTDDSAVEQLAVRRVFPGLEAGEQEVSHLLCTVHTMRTLNKRFKSEADKPIFNVLRHAMYAYTRIKCYELCEEAIFLARDEKTKNYIRTYWLDTSHKWAMYARSHSPLLEQVTSTNGSEAWHRQLKAGGGLRKGDASNHSNINFFNLVFLLTAYIYIGIRGMILHIMQQADNRDSKARKAYNDFRVKSLSIVYHEYPEVGLFPGPVQKLLGPEINAVNERIAQGKETPIFDENLTCHCK